MTPCVLNILDMVEEVGNEATMAVIADFSTRKGEQHFIFFGKRTSQQDGKEYLQYLKFF